MTDTAGAAAAAASTSASLSSDEIDATVWGAVSATVAANDCAGMAALYHPDAVLVSRTGTMAVVDKLVEWGADMDKIRSEGRTAVRGSNAPEMFD
jgi:hypothetical protein